jgi:4-hydroxyphenylpyruvate dioxygenase
MPTPEPIGIQRIEALHYYVFEAERMRRFLTKLLDFREIGGSDPTSARAAGGITPDRTRVFEAGGVRILVSEPTDPAGPAARFLARHPEGVGSLVFAVNDAARTFGLLVERGGTPLDDVATFHDRGGALSTFSIATPFGDTSFRFVERRGFADPFPGFAPSRDVAPGGNRFGFTDVDHVTSNFATMAPAALWLQEVLGFEKFWEVTFHTRDVDPDGKEGSGLRSIVHKDPSSPVKFADNEPLRPNYQKSQISLFRDDHGGDGVQHAAFSTPDLVRTVAALVEAGAQFLSTPGPYYDAMAGRLERCGVGTIDEDIETLRKLGILVDGDKPGKYLLQIFFNDMASIQGDRRAGPFFFELIQRKGDQGFGYGNFRALFESIERNQAAAGRT